MDDRSTRRIPVARHVLAQRVWRIVLSLVLAVGVAQAAPAARADALPAPDAPGPWAVGRLTLLAVDSARGGRALTVDAWYPVDPEAAEGEPSRYDLLLTSLLSPLAFDAPTVSERGPFPLVLFSHGNTGLRFQSAFLAEGLASHGFVVVAPDHAGDTAFDALFGTELPFERIALERPRDISFLITRMLERNATPGDPFEGRIDPGRIAVAGHSFGGFTALAVAAGFAGLVPPDPRVGAIVPISPASLFLSDAELASIRVPALILGGTSDVTTPIEPQSTRPFDLLASRPRYRADLLQAGHNSFTDICAIFDVLAGIGLPPQIIDFVLSGVDEACAPDLVPVAEAHRLALLYTVAFLERHLNGDGRYSPFLSPGFVRSQRLGVRFFEVPGTLSRGAGAARAED